MKILLMSAVALFTAGAFGTAFAQSTTNAGNATAFCQGALPNYEAGLRKRPLAIANESDANMFVSCSVPFGDTLGTTPFQLVVLVTNQTNTARSMSCTMVDGIAGPFPGSPPLYFPKTFVVPPMNYALVSWDKDDDNGGVQFRLVNLSCALPPGFEINTVQAINEPMD